MMIDRLVEQKKALIAYHVEFDLPDMLGTNDWSLLSKLLYTLITFQRTTKAFSRNDSSISQVIPFIHVLKNELCEVDDARGIISAKETMLVDMESRFGTISANKHYYIATLLDPRFKDRLIESVTVDLACDHLEYITATVREEVHEEDTASAHLPGSEEHEPPNAKQQKFDLWEKVHQVCKEKEETSAASGVVSPVREQLTRYLAEPVVINTNPIEWWASNSHKYPLLHKPALRYISCPPSSVASESLFSTTGHIDTDNRSSLLTENIEILAFIKKNIDLC